MQLAAPARIDFKYHAINTLIDRANAPVLLSRTVYGKYVHFFFDFSGLSKFIVWLTVEYF
jgi:hypothetical protein